MSSIPLTPLHTSVLRPAREDENHADEEARMLPNGDGRRVRDIETTTGSSSWKTELHNLLEHPQSSPSAFLVHIATTSLIVFSAAVTVLETIPALHSREGRVWFGIETALVSDCSLSAGALIGSSCRSRFSLSSTLRAFYHGAHLCPAFGAGSAVHRFSLHILCLIR